MEDRRTDRTLLVWLLLAGLFGTVIGVPASIAILREPATVWLSAGAEALLLAPAAAAGVWLGKRVGLGSGLRELVSRMPAGWRHVRSGFLPATLVGGTVGVVGFFAQNAIPKRALMPGLDNPSAFEWFLRCLSAALTEEIFFRLGLLTLFVWIIRSIVKKPTLEVPSLWLANLASALVFAGAHLPQLAFQRYGWSLLLPFLAFSSGAGMAMGWLYIRYGLVSAIVAHFAADLIVHVIPRWVAAAPYAWLRSFSATG